MGSILQLNLSHADDVITSLSPANLPTAVLNLLCLQGVSSVPAMLKSQVSAPYVVWDKESRRRGRKHRTHTQILLQQSFNASQEIDESASGEEET